MSFSVLLISTFDTFLIACSALKQVPSCLFDFPNFDLFYKTDDLYNCVIPFEVEELSRVEFLFDSIIEQLSIQPDGMWSCRARMAIIRIFDYAAKLHEGAFGVNLESDTLVDCILTFIEFNLIISYLDSFGSGESDVLILVLPLHFVAV